MIGKNFKSIVDNSNYSHEEMAVSLEISSATLYNLYKRDSIESKYIAKLSEITNEPIYKIMGGYSKNLEKNKNLELEETKEVSMWSRKYLEVQEKVNKLQDEISKAKDEVSKVKSEFIEFQKEAYKNQMDAFQKVTTMSLGKDKVYSKSKFETNNNKLVTNLNTSILAEC